MRQRPLALDLLVLALLVLYAVPYLWQVVTSLKPESELLRVPPFLPSAPTLDHYRVVFTQSAMPRALGNSLGVAALTTLLACAPCRPPTRWPHSGSRARARSCWAWWPARPFPRSPP